MSEPVAERVFHPLADIFPMLPEAEIAILAEDIRLHGLHMPIIVDTDGAIVDGRNRYRALQRLDRDTDPQAYVTTTLADVALVEYLVSLNLHRRHLNESQRTMVAEKLATMPWGRPRNMTVEVGSDKAANLPLYRKLDPQPSPPLVSQRQAAALLNVSERNLRDARQIRREGAPDLVHAVEGGKLSIHAAAALVNLPEEEQAALVARGKKEILAEAKAIREASRAANRAAILAKAGDTWTAFERQRQQWVEEYGYPVLANYHADPHLLAWAKATQRHVFIGRGSPWGNPFEVEKDGNRAYVIDSFAHYYWPRKLSLHDRVQDLAGKVLECYCMPAHCHGEVLLRLISEDAWQLLQSWLSPAEGTTYG